MAGKTARPGARQNKRTFQARHSLLAKEKLPVDAKWDKAQEKVIDGKHVVRVPISKESYFIFTKEGEGQVIKAYAYKVKDERKLKTDKEFTGKISWYSFNDNQLKSQRFKNGISKPVIIYTQKSHSKSETVTLDEPTFWFKLWCWLRGGWIGAHVVDPVCNFDVSGNGSDVSETNSGHQGGMTAEQLFAYLSFQGYEIVEDPGYTYGWNIYNLNPNTSMAADDEFATHIGGYNAFAEAEERDWVLTNTGYANELAAFLDVWETYTQTKRDFVSTTVRYLLEHPDVTWEEYREQYMVSPDVVIFAKNLGTLSLTQLQWLNQHRQRTNEMNAFLVYSPLEGTDKNAIITRHMDKMIASSAYLAYVESYSQFTSTSASTTGFLFTSSVMWWDNAVWLDNANNRNQDVSNGYSEALGLVSNASANLNIETNDETTSGYDTNVYSEYQTGDPWPTINTVIPIADFVKYRLNVNCLILAKEQLAKAGYQISGYGASGQTYKINTYQEGVDIAEAKKAAGYIKSALESNKPIIVGIDYMNGVPAKSDGTPANPDWKTDHFVVIVGMGTDTNGKFFRFFDSATELSLDGASPSNKLYYNEATGLIQGSTDVRFRSTTSQYRNSAGKVIYTITHVRKSKSL